MAMSANPHHIHELPIIVLFPHNRCNCRCVMCDIWRIRQVREITPRDLEPHLESFRALRVREVVFSGGEAQLNRAVSDLAAVFRAEGIRVTLLTAGLLLRSRAAEVAETIDELIVSLDGPPEVHNRIRNVPRAFERLAAGVAAVRQLRPDMRITARSTVQKQNFRLLDQTLGTAHALALDGISFLAIDITSGAFNREEPWSEARQSELMLTPKEIEELAAKVEDFIGNHAGDIASGYVAESEAKLQRIVNHFRASVGKVEPVAPRCNAPWVSAVIEADGSVRPCFFHPAVGNIHSALLVNILNGDTAVRFREQLDIESNSTCARCVCSLYLDESRRRHSASPRNEILVHQPAGL